MSSRTSIKDYKRHAYSGSRKSRKRSLGQMKRYHGAKLSRTEVWCLKTDGSNVPSSSMDDWSFQTDKLVKVYKNKKKIKVSPEESNAAVATSIKEPVTTATTEAPIENDDVIDDEIIQEDVKPFSEKPDKDGIDNDDVIDDEIIQEDVKPFSEKPDKDGIDNDDVIDDEIIQEDVKPFSEKPDKDGIDLIEEWAIKKQLCRCCLIEGTFDSLHSPAPGDDITYDDMLMQCFNIELFPVSSDVTGALRGVCGLCAARLRDAHAFRHQVNATEARFRDLYTRDCITVTGAATVKEEINQETINIDNYSGMDDTENSPDLDQRLPAKEERQPLQTEKSSSQGESAGTSCSTMRLHFSRTKLQKPSTTCEQCEKIFKTGYQLITHKLKEHNIDERHKCGACDKAFNGKYLLKRHVDDYHMMGERIKCSMCDFECNHQYALSRHMVKHKKSKDYHCKYCKKSFLRKTTLQLHEKIHTGEKKKQCAECGQAFVQKASLNYHMNKYHPNVKF